MNWNLSMDFPGLVLVAVLLLMLWVLWRAHSADNGLNFAEMLQDESGKASSSRLAMFICLAISSWAIMYILLTRKGEIDTWLFVCYVGIWSGAKVAEKAFDAYNASRGGLPSPVPRPAPAPSPRPSPKPPAPPPDNTGDGDDSDEGSGGTDDTSLGEGAPVKSRRK